MAEDEKAGQPQPAAPVETAPKEDPSLDDDFAEDQYTDESFGRGRSAEAEPDQDLVVDDEAPVEGYAVETHVNYRRINKFHVEKHPPGWWLRWRSPRRMDESGTDGYANVKQAEFMEWVENGHFVLPSALRGMFKKDSQGVVKVGRMLLMKIPMAEHRLRNKEKERYNRAFAKAGDTQVLGDERVARQEVKWGRRTEKLEPQRRKQRDPRRHRYF
jgi:hypothetical protein